MESTLPRITLDVPEPPAILDPAVNGRRIEDVALRMAIAAGVPDAEVGQRTLLEFHKLAQARAALPVAPLTFDARKLAEQVGQALELLKSPHGDDGEIVRLLLSNVLIQLGHARMIPR